MLMERMEPFGNPTARHHRPRRPVLATVARCVTAFFGGYAATAASATLLARLLPLARAEATVWAMVPAFLVYATVALWCFHEPRLARVLGGVWGAAILCAALSWLIGVWP